MSEKKVQGSRRTVGSWRYRVMKGYLHRVQKFKREAETLAEIEAWNKVEAWFRTIIEHKHINWKDVIILPQIELEEVKK